MSPEALLDILTVASKLKTTPRHCFTEENRYESVAEHSWRLALMAMLLAHESEYTDIDMNRVIRMCLIHDLGEAFTGDIPTFRKTDADAANEDELLLSWVRNMPEGVSNEWLNLLSEMNALETREAKLYKALDKLEAIISHNESDIGTWLPLEYDLQFTYGKENMEFSPYLKELRQQIDAVSRDKIQSAEGADKE